MGTKGALTGLEGRAGRAVVTVLALLLAAGALPPVARAEVLPESLAPIVIATNNWASQMVLADIAGQLLERIGYRVEYKGADPNMQFQVMGVGDIHVQVEVRHSTMADTYLPEIHAGRLIEAGRHEAVTRVGWWYPLYAERHCPELPEWEALKDCAEAFAPAEGEAGRLLAGPALWETGDAERVEGLGLGLVVEHMDNVESLWARLDRAIARRQPVLLFNWSPGWVEIEYPGRFVELPEYHRNCETDPSWGPVVDAIYDCGYPSDEPIDKAVWAGMPEQWPCAYEFIRRMSVTTEQLSEFQHLLDRRGLRVGAAASYWVEHNEAVWRDWLPPCAR